MTVGEYIEELKKVDPNLEICSEEGYCGVERGIFTPDGFFGCGHNPEYDDEKELNYFRETFGINAIYCKTIYSLG